MQLVLQPPGADVPDWLVTISANRIRKLTVTNREAFYLRFDIGPEVQRRLKESMAQAALTNAATAAAKNRRAVAKQATPAATIELLMKMDAYERAQHLDDIAEESTLPRLSPW